LPTERNPTIGTFSDEPKVKIYRILPEKLKIDLIQILPEKLKIDLIQIAGCIL
jgi:hypothetical protein